MSQLSLCHCTILRLAVWSQKHLIVFEDSPCLIFSWALNPNCAAILSFIALKEFKATDREDFIGPIVGWQMQGIQGGSPGHAEGAVLQSLRQSWIISGKFQNNVI